MSTRERVLAWFRTRAVEAAAIVTAGAAAWLRLRSPQHFLFGGDGGKMFTLAAQLNERGTIALAGIPSSKGIVNPPLSIWMLQVLEPLDQGVLVATMLTALAQVAALLLAFWIVRRYFSRRLALIALLLFASAPWAIYYARFVWQQNWIPLVSTVLLGALLAWVVEERPWMLLLAVICAGIILQLHFSGVCAFGVIGAVAVLQRPPLKRWPVVASTGFVIALFAPFAWYVTKQHGGVRGGSLFREFFVSPFVASAETLSTWGLLDQYRVDPRDFFAWLHPIAGTAGVWLIGLVVVCAGVAGAYLLGRDALGRLKRRGLLPWLDDLSVQGVVVDPAPTAALRARDTLLLFLIVPLAMYLVAGIHTHRHYVILLYPAIWIVAAWPLSLPRVRPGLAYGAVGVVAVLQSLVALRLQATVAEGVAPGAGVVYAEQVRAADWVCERVDTRPTLSSAPHSQRKVSANVTYFIDRCTRAGNGDARFLVIDETQLPLSDAAKAELSLRPHFAGRGIWIVDQN